MLYRFWLKARRLGWTCSIAGTPMGAISLKGKNMINNLKVFLNTSYTAYHAVENAETILNENGLVGAPAIKQVHRWACLQSETV